MKLALVQVQKNLDKIYTFIHPYLDIANVHCSEFISKNYWALLPTDYQHKLLSLSKTDLNGLPYKVHNCQKHSSHDEQQLDLSMKADYGAAGNECDFKYTSSAKPNCLPFSISQNSSCSKCVQADQFIVSQTEGHNKENEIKIKDFLQCGPSSEHDRTKQAPTFEQFCRIARDCTVEGCHLETRVEDMLKSLGVEKLDGFIGAFMNPKKCHEVEVMSELSAVLARNTGCKLVVDFGSGKGYLGSHLVLQHALPVLGIEARPENTQSAAKRSQVLSKQWSGLERNQRQGDNVRKISKKEWKKIRQSKAFVNKNGNNDQFDTSILAKLRNAETETTSVSSDDNKLENAACKAINFAPSDAQKAVYNAHSDAKKAVYNAPSDAQKAVYVPCTLFIDKNTDFPGLVKSNFPYLCSCSHNDDMIQDIAVTENARSITAHGANNDKSDIKHFNEMTETSSQAIIEDSLSNLTFLTETNFLCNEGALISVPSVDKNTPTTDSTDKSSKESVISSITNTVSGSVMVKSNSDKTSNKDSVKAQTDLVSTNSSSETISQEIKFQQHNNKTTNSKLLDSLDIDSAIQPSTVNNKLNTDLPVINDVKSVMTKSTGQPTKTSALCLTGLHTCGNLASTTVDVFSSRAEFKSMCSVACCYHLLTEKFTSSGTKERPVTDSPGFPMSQHLARKEVYLGAGARNLAAQSVHRIAEAQELQGERFYPRALLEVIVTDVCSGDTLEWKSLRRLEQKCSSTQEYIKRACEKLKISEKVTDVMIADYLHRYDGCRQQMAAFVQFKAILAPCIEALLILDRACFLLEQETVKEVYLVKMFDPVTSPRCHGILAIK